MIIFDLICEKCEHEMVDVMLSNSKSENPVCEKCGSPTKRMIGKKMTFKLLFDPKKDRVGWSFNNYENSHYWDDIKAEKEKGNKNYKPAI